MKTATEKDRLQKLRKQLKGHYSQIAEEQGVAVSTISRVLNGERENIKILHAAIEYRDRIKEKREKIMQQI